MRAIDPIEHAWCSMHSAPVPRDIAVSPAPVRTQRWAPTPSQVVESKPDAIPKRKRRVNVAEGERFYEGTPCRAHGHTLRYVSGGACVACMNMRNGRVVSGGSL